MKFQYVQNIESDEPVMLINKHIGFDEQDGMGIDGSLFQEELMALDNMGKKRIQVWINSVGGIVMDGYNICTAILKTKTPVDTYCMGMAASIAGVIFQTGRKRVMADYGILMYHNPYSGETTASPLLDSMKESLNTLIRGKCGMSEDAVQRMMDRTSFIQADEAAEMKLCDQVEHTVKLNTKYMPRTVNDGRRFYEAANRVLNKLFDNQTTSKMLKVTNKLSLTEDANEESILKAIEGIENRAVIAEEALNASNKKSAEELDKMKNDLDEMENKFNNAQKEYEDCKNALDAVNAEKEVVENAAKAEKAKNLIEDAVKIGKIKNEVAVMDEWKAKATTNFDETKALLDGIAMNKSASKFTIASKEGEAAVKYPSVGQAMAKLSIQMDKQK